MVFTSSAEFRNQPHQVKEGIWAFPLNHFSHHSRSWWIECGLEPVLVDCPPVNKTTIEFLKKLASGRNCQIILTNRESHGRVSELQTELGWSVLVQEQEAYLLPGLNQLKTFSNEHITDSGLRLLWTPGPTPGSCVVYAPPPWNVLFCGRLLIPFKINQLIALRTKKTFHWPRQQNSLEKLRDWLPREPRPSLASGTGSDASEGGTLVAWQNWITS
tara:strand:+ start:322 stop:969 length:648 start_codon:yes stop_codon:yes gene_type:complete